MSTFTLDITCLITSNLPWFMDLTFQVPMQYCSLQHQTLLLSPVTSTTGYCFCFGSIPSFFLELFLHWSPVAYLALTNMGSSCFSILSFCLFILFMGFSKQWLRGATSHPRSGAAANRSYHMSEVRIGGWEEQPHLQSVVAAQVQEGQEELVHVQGQEGRLFQGQEQWLCFAGAAVKRYPMSKVKETQVRR